MPATNFSLWEQLYIRIFPGQVYDVEVGDSKHTNAVEHSEVFSRNFILYLGDCLEGRITGIPLFHKPRDIDQSDDQKTLMMLLFRAVKMRYMPPCKGTKIYDDNGPCLTADYKVASDEWNRSYIARFSLSWNPLANQPKSARIFGTNYKDGRDVDALRFEISPDKVMPGSLGQFERFKDEDYNIQVQPDGRVIYLDKARAAKGKIIHQWSHYLYLGIMPHSAGAKDLRHIYVSNAIDERRQVL
jgi:hypothetical protein